MSPLPSWLEVDDEVQSALAEGRPVVALESSVWAHGLPRPMNLEVAGDTCRCVREAGAIPAIVAL
ncbi:MAG TPA: pseudouridine-5'-phosphate glycosidase, partial [Candidatus Nitrosotenuis sp.]|nr:pseudouridine-5'-phosphate glycosidase [Candidatus Nitrosotenuis sp.]